MANWITTIVKAENFEILKEKLLRLPTEEELKEDKYLNADDLIIDFNILIPRSKDLDITAGCYEWQTDRYGFGFNTEKIIKQNLLIKPFLDKLIHTSKTQSGFVKKVNKNLATHLHTFIEVYDIRVTEKEEITKHIENIVKGYYNLIKYGYKNWYKWSYDNWGTKWNVGEPMTLNEECSIISYQTANGLSLPVLKELSKYTPLVVTYADEDTGSNYSILKIANSEVEVLVDDTNKSIGEAMACRGEGEENMDEDYSEDNYTDDEILEYFKTDRETFLNKEHQKYQETENLINSLF